MLKNRKEKKIESNKIVIKIDRLNSDNSINQNEEKKNESNFISLFEINDYKENKENENFSSENNSNADEIKSDVENEKNVGKLKLIKPIIIW